VALPADDALNREVLPLTALGVSERRRPFLGWPSISVVSMMLAAALYQPLSGMSALRMGNVTLQPIDIALFFVLSVVLLEALVRTDWKPVPRPIWPMVTLILLLSWPIALGMTKGYGFQSIMYQGRVAVYYALFFAYWQLIPNKRIATHLLLTMIAIAVVGAAYGLFAHIMGFQWHNGMSNVPTSMGDLSRGFGWWSAMPWYVWGATIALAYAWLSTASFGKRLTMACVCGALVVSSLSTFMRSDLVGMVFGFGVVILFGLRDSQMWRRTVNRLWAALPVLALVVVLGVGIAYSVNKAYVSAVVERVRSLGGSTQTSSSVAEVTRQIRINAMADGVSSAVRHPLGIGYGYLPGREVDTATARYAAQHDVIAWVGYFSGIVGGGILVLCFTRLGFHLRRRVVAEHEYGWAAISVAAVLAAMLGQSLGYTYFFDAPYGYVLVPLFLAMALTFGVGREGTGPSGAGER
jgi:hypothetical protein